MTLAHRQRYATILAYLYILVHSGRHNQDHIFVLGKEMECKGDVSLLDNILIIFLHHSFRHTFSFLTLVFFEVLFRFYYCIHQYIFRFSFLPSFIPSILPSFYPSFPFLSFLSLLLSFLLSTNFISPISFFLPSIPAMLAYINPPHYYSSVLSHNFRHPHIYLTF